MTENTPSPSPNPRYMGWGYRCDSCGGSAKNCCDTPYPVMVSYLHGSALLEDGADHEDNIGKARHEYTLPNGDRYYDDYNGWGADFLPA